MGLATTFVFAQSTSSDSLKIKTDTTKKYHISFGDDDDSDWHGGRHHHRHQKTSSGFNFGITFSRFDLGLATLVDNGSFTLSQKNSFLDYRSWKTSTVGFDVIQFGYRFADNFKIYLSGGFDWTLIRLEKNITILPDQPTLTYREDDIHYSKNRFSANYLRIPLSFDIRSGEDSHGKRAHFVFGPEAGLLLGGMVKQISPEFGKKKFYDDYHFAKVRYGAFARLGYDGWGFFAKYYINDMFENSPNQAGLKNFSFGLMFGF
ncbi:MAG: PorT family protein [Mucilaginibacter sp.]|jgi:hypothetical protein|nr:PorT family protein [Mucilaginibacter sp.]